jgi:hypothetical protein
MHKTSAVSNKCRGFVTLNFQRSAPRHSAARHPTTLRYTPQHPTTQRHSTMKICLISDLHCGHKVGLTPPDYWVTADSTSKDMKRIRAHQEEHWNFFEYEVKKRGPYDAIICNGDAIDGPSLRCSGDRLHAVETQAKAAYTCIKQCFTRDVTKAIYLTGGTPYHTFVPGIDVEELLAESLRVLTPDVHYTQTMRLEIDLQSIGLKKPFVIAARHHVNGSNHRAGGAGVAAARTIVDELLKATNYDTAVPDCIVRSHIHETCYMQRRLGNGRIIHAMITPALQGAGSDYGLRRCDGTVNFGFTVLDLAADEGQPSLSVDLVVADLKTDRPVTNKLKYAKH